MDEGGKKPEGSRKDEAEEIFLMDINILIKGGESDTVEFKTAFGKEVIITLVAFANTTGGKIVVGVDGSGKVVGIEAGSETVQQY